MVPRNKYKLRQQIKITKDPSVTDIARYWWIGEQTAFSFLASGNEKYLRKQFAIYKKVYLLKKQQRGEGGDGEKKTDLQVFGSFLKGLE